MKRQKPAMQNSAVNRNQQQSPAQPITGGYRRWSRDNTRQRDYIADQDWATRRDWNAQVDIENTFDRRTPQPDQRRLTRNRQRATAWKKKKDPLPQQSVEPDLTQYRSTRDSGDRDEPMYTAVGGSRPVHRIYAQNLEFSSFPLVCDVTYRELKQVNPRLRR